MRELILKIINDYDLPIRDTISFEQVESRMIDAFIDFGEQVAELQKKECDEYYNKNWFHIEKETMSILKCKNVCIT